MATYETDFNIEFFTNVSVSIESDTTFYISNAEIGVNTSLDFNTDFAKFIFNGQDYHTKLYGIALGNFDLSHAVTAVSATINATQKSLNVTLAGAELIDEINARATDELRFFMYYLNHKTGQVDESVDLITVPFIDIDPRLGGRSSSLALSGQSLPDEHTGTTIAVADVEYLTATQLRIPVNFNIKPGDTVNHDYGQILANSVTYSLSNNNQFMTITAA